MLGSGAVIGLLLAFSTAVVVSGARRGFGLTLGIVVAIMMVSYVADPVSADRDEDHVRKRRQVEGDRRRGFLGAVVCAPPYVLGRIGLLMLGSHTLFFLGIVFVSVGLVLEAGATSAVKAIKMSAKLVAGQPVANASIQQGAQVQATASGDGEVE